MAFFNMKPRKAGKLMINPDSQEVERLAQIYREQMRDRDIMACLYLNGSRLVYKEPEDVHGDWSYNGKRHRSGRGRSLTPDEIQALGYQI
jgi:hypothetical protein